MTSPQKNDETQKSRLPGWAALTPLAIFLGVYLVTSLVVHDFYKVPISVAFLIASVFAILISAGRPVKERIAGFSTGAANPNILLMIWIFILAGAFAQSAKAMGAVEATVNLTLHVLPGNLLLAGLFIAACFISLSIGTSVGTIVALTPVAAGLAGQVGLDIPFIVAVVAGGAFFGDNLSFISDTTIAATRTQGCRMQDKFKVNILIVGPAALLVLFYYIFCGLQLQAPLHPDPVQWVKVIPYLVVLGTALAGVNVILVLTIGILVTGITGLLTGGFDTFGWFGAMGDGISGMGELIIVTLLAGGMLETIRLNGGIDYIIDRLTRRISGKRGAELCIAALVSLANLCTANNTIAIITVGGIAKDIATRFGVDPRKSASLLDTFSCLVQGLIPYGAQMLMAASLAAVSPVEIIGCLYYPMLTGIAALAAILFRYPKKYA
ncbi:MAG: Na+/H+ antiporter NhaC family protein [Coprobacter sp.]|nr:Na+/H+ antiporter NhaC family protein [Coprobacter sp.]